MARLASIIVRQKAKGKRQKAKIARLVIFSLSRSTKRAQIKEISQSVPHSAQSHFCLLPDTKKVWGSFAKS
jgi:hypothetical protein